MESTTTKRVFSPATRFVVDVNDKGVQKIDKYGNPISGQFTVVISEMIKESSPLVASFTENVTGSRYRMYREETDALDVDGVMDYFPTLREQYNKYVGIEEKNEDADAKEPTSEGPKTPGPADGKPRTKKAKQESQSPDQVTPEEVAAE